MIEVLVIAVATASNFLLLKWKLEHKRYADFLFDITVLFALASFFGGTLQGMVIAMVSGAIVSTFLLVKPPRFVNPFKDLLSRFKSLINKNPKT